MKLSVANAFYSANIPIEGKANHMYLDREGLVTTAVGYLLDVKGKDSFAVGPAMAIQLPWLRKDGTRASVLEIEQEWRRVKSLQADRAKGGLSSAFTSTAQLRLTDQAVMNLTQKKLQSVEKTISNRFRNFQDAPADSQLGVLNMAWAMGPFFNFPKFKAHFELSQWDDCAAECAISAPGDKAIDRRNAMNKTLFRNAAIVEKYGMDKEKLYWPSDATKPATHAGSGLCPVCGQTIPGGDSET